MAGLAQLRLQRLRKRMNDPDPARRAQTADRLAEIGDEGAVASLRHLLRDDEPPVRAAAVAALHRATGADAAKLVLPHLADDAEVVRQAAAAALAATGVPPDLGPLTLALALDGHDLAQRLGAACSSLLVLDGGEVAIRNHLLERTATPTAQRVQDAMVTALGSLGAAGIVALDSARRNKREDLRVRAAKVLGVTGAPEALDPLLRLGRDPAPAVRKAAAQALNKLDGAAVADRLLADLEKTAGPTRTSIIDVLAKLGDSRAAPAIAALLDGSSTRDGALAVAVTDAVRMLRDRSTLATLTNQARALVEASADPSGRGVGALMLGALGDQAAAPLLRALLTEVAAPVHVLPADARSPQAWLTPDRLLSAIGRSPTDSAAWALGRLADPDTIDELVDYLDRREVEARNDGPLENDSQVAAHWAVVRSVGDLAAAVFEPFGKAARAPLLARAQEADRPAWWPFDALAAVADKRTATKVRALHDAYQKDPTRLRGSHDANRAARVRERLP